MAMLGALTATEVDVAIAEHRAAFAVADLPPARLKVVLRELHETLLQATVAYQEPPLPQLAAAAELVRGIPSAVVASTPRRPQTVWRLLVADSPAAAWAVLVDNATGVVETPLTASTATGAVPSASRLPLLTKIEPPYVFADLPGFRDPRFGAPDDCYDMTDSITVKQSLDEVLVDGGVIKLGGWAALEAVTTDQSERVRVVAERDGVAIATDGVRRRRPDLVTGTGVGLRRRAWAGWMASLDLLDGRWLPGAWSLSLEITHKGIVRRTEIGDEVSEIAAAMTRGPMVVGGRSVRWTIDDAPWQLVIG